MLNRRRRFALLAVLSASALVAGCVAPAAPAATATTTRPITTHTVGPQTDTSPLTSTSTPAPSFATAAARGLLDPYPEVERISPQDAKAALDAGLAVFVDVRPPEYFNNELIPGAIHIPIDHLGERIGELDKGDWIITYCV